LLRERHLVRGADGRWALGRGGPLLSDLVLTDEIHVAAGMIDIDAGVIVIDAGMIHIVAGVIDIVAGVIDIVADMIDIVADMIDIVADITVIVADVIDIDADMTVIVADVIVIVADVIVIVADVIVIVADVIVIVAGVIVIVAGVIVIAAGMTDIATGMTGIAALMIDIVADVIDIDVGMIGDVPVMIDIIRISSACLFLHRNPLLVKLKGLHPFFDVPEVERLALHLDNAGRVVKLPLTAADLRPLQFRDQYVFRRSEGQTHPSDLVRFAPFKFKDAEFAIPAQNQVGLQTSGEIDDVELCAAAVSIQRRFGMNSESHPLKHLHDAQKLIARGRNHDVNVVCRSRYPVHRAR
jgi:hypothetical protein